MSSLIPVGSSTGLSSRAQRQLGAEIARIQARGVVLAAREVTSIHVIEEVTEAALLATTRLSRLETALALEAPNASGRLHFIAEAAALGMGAVVQQTTRKVIQ
jgi:hypothetical protein